MKYILIISIFVFLGHSAMSSDPEPKIKFTSEIMEDNTSHSNINISISIAKQAILDSLNKVIDESLATDFDLGYRDLEIKTWKTEQANFNLVDKDLFLDLSLKIWAKKDIIFADAEATGILKMVFKTSFDVDKKWKIKSDTKLHHYEWIDKPIIEVGIIKLPAESIANIIIDRTKEEIGKQIDYSISESIVIDKDVFELYDAITKTRLIDDVNQLWLEVNPIEVNVKKVKEYKDSLTTVINFISDFNIVAGVKPKAQLALELPPFNWVDRVDEKTRVKLKSSISMDQVRNIVRDSFVGRQFKSGKREILIDSIEVIPEGEKLIIESYISGTINGKATIKGKPEFDSKSQEMKVSKLGLRLKTPNIFKKIGFWFAKGKIKKEIRKQIQYSLKDQMEEVRQAILTEINAYNQIDGINVNSEAKEIIIDDIYFGKDEITGNLTAIGNIHISILDIRALSKFDIESLK
jgi:hypothetical protein